MSGISDEAIAVMAISLVSLISIVGAITADWRERERVWREQRRIVREINDGLRIELTERCGFPPPLIREVPRREELP